MKKQIIQKKIEDILKKNRKPMKPREIKEQLNAWLRKNGEQEIETLYMSRQKTKLIKQTGTDYSYNFSRERRIKNKNELKSLLEHVNLLQKLDSCTPIVLRVDSGYEKIICNLLNKLYGKKGLFLFEGIGCILMVVSDMSILESPTLKEFKKMLNELERKNALDIENDSNKELLSD